MGRRFSLRTVSGRIYPANVDLDHLIAVTGPDDPLVEHFLTADDGALVALRHVEAFIPND